MKKLLLVSVFSFAIILASSHVAFAQQAGGLNAAQVQSILGILRSFGAAETTVQDVNSALTGQPSAPQPLTRQTASPSGGGGGDGGTATTTPTITVLSPASGPVGTSVLISGNNLYPNPNYHPRIYLVGRVVSPSGEVFPNYGVEVLPQTVYSNGREVIFTIPSGIPGTLFASGFVPGPIKVSVDTAREIGGESNQLTFTITAVAERPIITPERVTVNSGENVTLNFTVPPTTLRTLLYVACPKGLTTTGTKEFSGDLCNRWLNFGAEIRDVTLTFVNGTANALRAAPNFYVYKADRPTFAVGVASEVIVNPATPTPVAVNAPKVTLSVNGFPSTGYQEPTVNIGNERSARIRWNATNTTRCNTYGQTTLKLSDGARWNENNLSISGERMFYTSGQVNELGEAINGASIGVQCWNGSVSESKGVVVSWINPAPVATLGPVAPAPKPAVTSIPTPTYTSTQTETETPTPTPTDNYSSSQTVTAAPAPTPTATPTETTAPTPTPTYSPSSSPTYLLSPSPTSSPSPSGSPSAMLPEWRYNSHVRESVFTTLANVLSAFEAILQEIR